MSHFPVLVVTDRPDEGAIEQALIPFQEHACTGKCPKEYMTFNDTEAEYLDEYQTKSRKMFRNPAGELFSPYDDKFRVPNKPGTFDSKYETPDGWTEVEVPFKQLHSTFEQFMREWTGSDERDPETGRFGYWENPNKKWDWWAIGGRWKHELAYRNGKGSRPADQARVGDLDFEHIRLMRAGRALQSWDEAQADRAKMEATDKMTAEQMDGQIEFVYGIKPGSTRDDYIAQCSKFSLHGVLMDGKWYERGQMGWWGIVSFEDGTAEQSNASTHRDEWQTKFDELLHSLDPNKYVTVVDCHT